VKQFVWEPAAPADLRRIDRENAMRILLALTHYGETGEDDVKRLTDRGGLYRLRVGKWRVFSTLTHQTQFEFTASTTAGRRIKAALLTTGLISTTWHDASVPGNTEMAARVRNSLRVRQIGSFSSTSLNTKNCSRRFP
jgi:mRNA-degrading endonuclease RelE of RelBE toxin-antitoxin system